MRFNWRTFLALFTLSLIVSSAYNLNEMYTDQVLNFNDNYTYVDKDYEICHYDNGKLEKCEKYTDIILKEIDHE